MKTIFVLDDDPEQAELMAQALTGRGRRVRAFSDPIRALAALTLDGADLLIADLSMPWIDGKDVVASAHLRRPELKIFMVSGYPRGAEIAGGGGRPLLRQADRSARASAQPSTPRSSRTSSPRLADCTIFLQRQIVVHK